MLIDPYYHSITNYLLTFV